MDRLIKIRTDSEENPNSKTRKKAYAYMEKRRYYTCPKIFRKKKVFPENKDYLGWRGKKKFLI